MNPTEMLAKLADLEARLEKSEADCARVRRQSENLTRRFSRFAAMYISDGFPWDQGTVLQIPKPPSLYYDLYPRRKPLYGSASLRSDSAGLIPAD